MKVKGLKTWFLERFPPMNFISGFFMYILPKTLSCFYFSDVHWSWRDLLGILIPAMHLLILRVFDEHKDYVTDKVFHPHRSLQKGIVQLSQVKMVGCLAFAVQLLCFLGFVPGLELWMLYLGTWIWTLLMWKEFFIKEWLKKNYMAYALLHMLITPAIFLLCLRLVQGPHEFDTDFLLLGFFTSWIYEVSRKTKAPEEETGDSSYSKLWGIKFACFSVLIQGFLILWVGENLLSKVSLMNWICWLIFVLLFLMHAASLFKFVRAPSAKGRKSNEGTSALISLSIFVIPVMSWIIHCLRS